MVELLVVLEQDNHLVLHHNQEVSLEQVEEMILVFLIYFLLLQMVDHLQEKLLQVVAFLEI
jgi:hypothetical protein